MQICEAFFILTIMDKIIIAFEAMGFVFDGKVWIKETEQCTLIAGTFRLSMRYDVVLSVKNDGCPQICIFAGEMKKAKKIVKLLSED